MIPRTSKIKLGKVFLKDYFGINKALMWMLIFKAWLLLKGPASVFFLISFLTPAQQGYWYVFINLSALALFAELGFNTIITQFVSHEYASLKLKNGIVDGPRYNIDRLFGIVKYAVKFYAILVPIAVVLMWVFGYIILAKEKQTGLIVAWFAYSSLGAINLLLSLAQYIYQGLDRVEDIQKNILLGAVSMALCSWVLLILGYKIWALVIGNLVGLLLMSIFLLIKTNKFWIQLFQHKASRTFNWLKEIALLQGRYAVSWIGGFFIGNFITPIVMFFNGPSAAGKVGMTLSIIASLGNISNAWGMVNIPQFNILVAQNNNELLDNLFRRIQRQSLVVYLIGGFFLIILFVFIFPMFRWDGRLLSLPDLLILLAAGFAGLRIANMAFYLRAHKEEPYMWLSVINGVMTSALVMAGLYFFKSVSIAIRGYVLSQFFSFYIAHFIFIGKKREYNSQLRLVDSSYE